MRRAAPFLLSTLPPTLPPTLPLPPLVFSHPAYLSPELLSKGCETDDGNPKDDIWALGIVALELWTVRILCGLLSLSVLFFSSSC